LLLFGKISKAIYKILEKYGYIFAPLACGAFCFCWKKQNIIKMKIYKKMKKNDFNFFYACIFLKD